MAKKRTGLLGSVGDRLTEYIKQYSRLNYTSQIYDDSGKTLDISKLIPPKELSKILTSISTSSHIYGQSMFEKFFDLQVGRAARYSEYEQILYRIPEASQALQVYVDSILSPNVGDRENQVQYNTINDSISSKRAKNLIEVMLKRSKFFDMLPQVIYTSLLYGDSIVEIDPTESGIRYVLHTPKNCTILYDEKTDIELGIIIQQESTDSGIINMLSYVYPSLNISPPSETVAIVSSGIKEDFQEKNVEKQIEHLLEDLLKDYGVKYKYISPRRYVKFPVYYNNMYYPYGTSLFDPVRSIAKQLLLVEAALSIYRATRTPLRTLWSIEVGSTPEAEIPSLVNGIMDRIRRQKVIDPDSGGSTSLDSIPEMMSLEEDIWTPTINGQSLIKADPIPSGDINPYTSDAEYFKKKLIASLGLPPAYLAEEQAAGTRALLTLEDIKFSRTIRKYQTDINNSLQDLVNICFLLTKNTQYYNLISLSLPEPKTIEDNIRVENISSRLTVADSFISTFPNVPKLWVMKNLVGLSDDDIDEMVDMIDDQRTLAIFNEQIPGEAHEEGSGGIGGGGFGDEFGEGEFGEEFGEGEFELGESENENINTLEGPMGEVNIEDLNEEEAEETEEIPENL